MFITGLIDNDADFGEGWALKIGDTYLAGVMEDFNKQLVCIAFAFSNEPITKERFLDIAIGSSIGEVDALLINRYSEITGFLYTDERGRVGGHNLIDIFDSHQGEYGALIIQTDAPDLTELAE